MTDGVDDSSEASKDVAEERKDDPKDDQKDDAVPYEELNVDRWTECRRFKQGATWHVTGTCSRCHHRTDKRFGPVVVSQVAGEDAQPEAKEQVIECDCGKSHEGREKDAQPAGCGAIWWGSVTDG